MQGDLTTLSRAQAWLGISNPSDASNVLLSRLISASSRFVMNFVQRTTFAPMTVTDCYDGTGRNFLVLRQWPVLQISSINFCGVSITTPAVGNPLAPGYLLESLDTTGGSQQRLSLVGYCFPRERSSVFVNYSYGYQITGEAQQVPTTSAYKITTTQMWLSDQGVTYANGTPMTYVSANPAQGQYTIDSLGNYVFSSGDSGAAVLISYGYVPFDVEQACIELIGEAYRRKDRIGEVSKSLGGQETVSFSQKDMHDAIRLSLQPFLRVAPS